MIGYGCRTKSGSERVSSLGRFLMPLLIVVGIVILLVSTPFSYEDILKGGLTFPDVEWSLAALLLGGVIYAILLSIPFVPGIELGLLLMLMMGKGGIIIVYLCTIAGLNLSFAIGRWLPVDRLRVILGKEWIPSYNIKAASLNAELLERFRWGKRVGKGPKLFLAKYHYLLIGVLINTPGNFVLGGGGGISMLSGMTRQVSWKCFLLTVTIATLPVPLLVLLGWLKIESLF